MRVREDEISSSSETLHSLSIQHDNRDEGEGAESQVGYFPVCMYVVFDKYNCCSAVSPPFVAGTGAFPTVTEAYVSFTSGWSSQLSYEPCTVSFLELAFGTLTQQHR